MPIYLGDKEITTAYLGNLQIPNAIIGGEPIITGGLELYLDASNPLSYPTSGSIWYDLSGNGRNVTLVNSPTFEGPSAIDDGALLFNGSTQYATAYTVPGPLFIGSWTWTFWCRVGTVNIEEGNTLFAQGQDEPAPDRPAQMFLTRSGLNTLLAVGYGTQNHPSVAAISNNTTYQFTGVHDATNNSTSIYINGLPDRLDVANTAPVWADTNLEFGRYNVTGAPSPTAYWNGRIQEIYFYSRVLSSAEILDNFNARKSVYGL